MRWFKRAKIKISGNLPNMKTISLEEDNNNEFSTNIEQNEKILQEAFQDCSDLVYRKIEVNQNTKWLIVYIDNLINTNLLEEHVIKPMLTSVTSEKVQTELGDLKDEMISIGATTSSTKVSDTIQNVLEGHAAILMTGNSNVMTVCIPGTSKRSIDEASSEPVIRGPRDGFIEHISTNISLIRSRLKTPKLKVEYITLGEHTQTKIAITYLKGVALDSLVEEVRTR
jgi:spore germination protein